MANNGYVKATSPDALELDLPYGAFASINGLLIDNTQLT